MPSAVPRVRFGSPLENSKTKTLTGSRGAHGAQGAQGSRVLKVHKVGSVHRVRMVAGSSGSFGRVWPNLERLPESEREHIAVMLAARLAQRGELLVDYVRLNILAKREVAT